MTGIQALERAYPTESATPGQVERQEFEYPRYGTQSLIANWQVATGTVLCPSMADTRTEADFATHIETTVKTESNAGWVFIVDLRRKGKIRHS